MTDLTEDQTMDASNKLDRKTKYLLKIGLKGVLQVTIVSTLMSLKFEKRSRNSDGKFTIRWLAKKKSVIYL